jgi:hypothetical protein
MKMKERKKILIDPFSLTFSKSQSTIFSLKSLPFFFFSQISSNFPRFSSNQNKHRRAFHKPKASIFFLFFCVITNYILYLFSFELTLAKRKKKKNSLAKATKNRGKKQQIFIKKGSNSIKVLHKKSRVAWLPVIIGNITRAAYIPSPITQLVSGSMSLDLESEGEVCPIYSSSLVPGKWCILTCRVAVSFKAKPFLPFFFHFSFLVSS